MATLTGPDLERALKDGPLAQSTTTLTGMVKASDKEGHVAFTRAGCEQWTDLPTDLIAEAETIGQQTCRDHSHPVVRLTLSVGDDPTTQLLASLLAQAAPAPLPMPMPIGLEAQAATAPPPGFDSFIPSAPSAPEAAGPMARLGPAGGLGGMGGVGGGLNAWGCWTGSCCTAGRWVAGPLGRHWVCDRREPCERCIWPW